VVDAANVYIDMEAPWALKENRYFSDGNGALRPDRGYSLPVPHYSTRHAYVFGEVAGPIKNCARQTRI
jgi:hypothetical protein